MDATTCQVHARRNTNYSVSAWDESGAKSRPTEQTPIGILQHVQAIVCQNTESFLGEQSRGLVVEIRALSAVLGRCSVGLRCSVYTRVLCSKMSGP
jgi:hypothetical protein